MKKSLKNILFALVLIVACLIYSGNVFAALERPYFSLNNGTWNYDINTHALTMNFGTIGTSLYKDGTFDTISSPDIIRGGTIKIGSGVIYNGGADSMVFGSQVGGTGSMNFSVFEGTTNYFTAATMNNFIVSKNGSLTQLNPGYNAFHISSISTNSGVTSHFLNDVNSWSVPVGNLFFQFTCTAGDCANNNFTANASGTLTGGKLSVVPEPVSSLLFLTGGAALAFRRYSSKKRAFIN